MKLTRILRYPVKSTRGHAMQRAQLGKSGIKGDRGWIILDENGKQITAREEPRLLLISCTLVPEGLRLQAPSLPDQTVTRGDAEHCAQIFRKQVTVAEGDPETDAWLSDYLGRPARLMHATPQTARPYAGDSYRNLGDAAPVLIASQTSTAELARHLPLGGERDRPGEINIERFRPNLVIDGAEPFVEDHWQTIRIGDMVFEVTEPCVRCILTTIDPETGRKDLGMEPLRSLAKFHTTRDEQGITFGVYAVPRGEGEIQVGQTLNVLSRSPRPHGPSDKTFAPPPGRRVFRITGRSSAGRRGSHIWGRCDDNAPTPVKPGQYASLHFPQSDGSMVTRNYTVSGTSPDERSLRFSVRAQEEGLVSGWLNSGARAGDSLLLSGIHGELTSPKRPGLLLSAGSGITPFLAMARHDPDLAAIHLHYERDAHDLMGTEDLHNPASDAYEFRLMLTPKTGRISPTHLAGIDLRHMDILICGPDGFVSHCKELLGKLGATPGRIKTESFSGAAGFLDKGADKTHSVTLEGEEPVEISEQESLLAGLRRHGLTVPSSCEIGNCQTCLLELRSGHVASSVDAHREGFVLACSSAPRSDLVLARLNKG